jgi:hypothetical protein
MVKKVGNLNESDINKIRTESIGLLNDLDAIGKSINSNLQKVSQLTGESTAGYKENFNAAKILSDALSKIDSDTLKSQKQQKVFQDKIRKAQEEATKLEAKANRLRAEAVNFSKEQAREAYRVARGYEDGAEKLREQAKSAEKVTDEFEKLNKQTKIFDNMAEFTQQIPGLSKVLGDFQRASDAAREAASTGGNALAAGGKELAGLAGKAIAAFAVGNFVKAVNDLDERTTSAARNLNMSRDQASKLAMNLNDATKNIAGITGKEAQLSVEQFADTLGTTVAISAEDAVNFTTMTKQLGLATNEASKLETLSLAIGKSSKSITQNIIGEVKFSNYRNKSAIDYKKVLKDVGNTNAAILLSIKGQGKGLGEAGAAARRFGLDLNKVDSIASSLLNFEESISAELEAELLTGKDLNLEEARRFALNGDIEGLTREIQKNVGNAADFSKMNRLQQEAIAKSVGMSREELAASLIEQEALTKLGAKDAKERDAKVEAEMANIEALRKAGKFSEAETARKQLVDKLGSDELIRQRENRSLAELQLEATQKMAESMDNLASKVLPSIQGLMEKMVEHADTLAKVLTVIGGAVLFSKIAKMGKMFGKMAGWAKSIAKFFGMAEKAAPKVLQATMKSTGKTVSGAAAQTAVKAGTATATKVAGKAGTKMAAKAGSKVVGKGLAKRIPIIGSLVGLGFAIDRLAKGDTEGALLETGSAGLGLLDLVVPGLGTGLSLAADAGIAARDFSKSGTITPGSPKNITTKGTTTSSTKEIPVKDYIIKTLPEDTIVGAGGTKLGRTDEMVALLQELISAVKTGGNVYLDGNKVGTAMAMGTFKTQ